MHLRIFLPFESDGDSDLVTVLTDRSSLGRIFFERSNEVGIFLFREGYFLTSRLNSLSN
ncbi:hypothetical protein LEP1GSC125_0344 [Leptospira mayottensis 200901122]|uniref:Uncharacterized protein n=1 Tax=Leptospira mayottensis 200901122 TaxID=1193010 RepID=A0AA87MKM7_9LEPT|nr:hypothetical protein LEP1GSC125_0344 [Leptospira mayottensis 200901122]